MTSSEQMLNALIKVWNYYSEFIGDDNEADIMLHVQKAIERETGKTIAEAMA